MEDSLRKGIILTPIDILEIQTMYDTLFGVLHNGGTWFIGCLIFAYFVYPLLQELVKSASFKVKIFMASVVCFILIYSNYIVVYFGLSSNYSNPVYRVFEFALGVIMAAICKDIAEKEIKSIKAAIFSIFVTFELLYVIYTSRMVGIVMLKELFVVPLICMLLMGVYFIKNKRLEKNKLLIYCSSLSYYFFILQLILWTITDSFIKTIGLDGNKEKIIISFILCVIMSIITNELFDKPIKKVLRKKLLK